MPTPDKPLGRSKLHGPARDFAEFCEAEFERRRNSDAPFDEESYREARDMVLSRLAGDSEQDAA